MGKRKRKLAKRKTKKEKNISNLAEKLIKKLKEIAKDKTPPEVVNAHVDFYYQCSDVEQQILWIIFKRMEDKQLTEIAKYYNEVA